MKMVPIENESAVQASEFCVALFLCKKVEDGRMLPQELPASLEARLSPYNESSSESSSDYSSESDRSSDNSDSYSESSSSSYSDYSDSYSDYSESSSDSFELIVQKPVQMANAFARKGRSSKSSVEKMPTEKSPKGKSQAEKSPSAKPSGKINWKMPDETRNKLEKEVFPRYAGEAKEMSLSTLRETFLNAGVNEETVQAV